MTKPDRIACCVPFCGRTAKRLPDDHPDTQIICGPHFRLADADLRALHRKARRRARWWLANRTFDRIKNQAIERCAGITR